jgi:hypothetical protein
MQPGPTSLGSTATITKYRFLYIYIDYIINDGGAPGFGIEAGNVVDWPVHPGGGPMHPGYLGGGPVHPGLVWSRCMECGQ